jgi:signal transduction histidine kinase
VAIPDLIDSVASLVQQTAARSVVTFETEIAADLPGVRCDPEQIRQVLLNLLLNAVQAMPEGGTVSLVARKEPGMICIQVRDTGMGIPQSNVESIYDPFFTTKQNGTGLGLAVGYQIMQQHGGELRLEQNGPGGACFAMLLPVGDLNS